jgi:WD40 repeat protein
MSTKQALQRLCIKVGNLTLSNKLLLSLGFGLALLSFGPVAKAAPYTKGNVFLSTGQGSVIEYTPTGTAVQTLTGGSSFMTGSAFDVAGNFYVTNFGANTVRKYDANGTSPGTLFGGGYSTPEMIVFDKLGNAYVGSIGGGIRKFDSAGNFLSAFSAPRVDFMDLAADQTTMYFGQEQGEVKRWDLTTNTALTDFSTDVENAFAMRILPNGNLLVADGSDIELLNSSGAQIGAYDISSAGLWFALNIDDSGTSFWSATTDGLVAEFDIATGTVLNQWNSPGNNGTYGLAIFGEVTQGGGGNSTNSVPGPLPLLGVGAAFGFSRKLRSRIKARAQA